MRQYAKHWGWRWFGFGIERERTLALGPEGRGWRWGWYAELGPLSVWDSGGFAFGASINFEPLVWGVPTLWVQIAIPYAHVRLTLIPGLWWLIRGT